MIGQGLRQLSDRARAYITRRNCYRTLFLDAMGNLSRPGQVVVKDLARFCDAYRSTIKVDGNGNMDPLASAVAQGRREVWLRLQANLSLPDEAVLQAMENDQ